MTDTVRIPLSRCLDRGSFSSRSDCPIISFSCPKCSHARIVSSFFVQTFCFLSLIHNLCEVSKVWRNINEEKLSLSPQALRSCVSFFSVTCGDSSLHERETIATTRNGRWINAFCSAFLLNDLAEITSLPRSSSALFLARKSRLASLQLRDWQLLLLRFVFWRSLHHLSHKPFGFGFFRPMLYHCLVLASLNLALACFLMLSLPSAPLSSTYDSSCHAEKPSQSSKRGSRVTNEDFLSKAELLQSGEVWNRFLQFAEK